MGAIGKIIDGKYVQFANDKKGGAVTIPNLEPEKVLVSSSSGAVTASEISTDKLEMLSNVTSDIQKQIDDLSEKIGEEGGLGGVPLGDCSNLGIRRGINMFSLNWSDPENIVFNGEILAEWAGTKLVRKRGDFSANADDGDLVVDSKERNAYAEIAFEDSGIESGEEYCYTLFPYTVKNIYTMSDKNKMSDIAISFSDVLSENTWEAIALVSESGKADKIWKLGDSKDGFTIIGFNHDDLADGSGKAGITFWMNSEYENKQQVKWSNTNSWYSFPNTYLYRIELAGWINAGEPKEEISKHIKEVKKMCAYTNSGSQAYNSTFKLFLLSYSELGKNDIYKYNTEGEKYEGIEEYIPFSEQYYTRTPRLEGTNTGGGLGVKTVDNTIYWTTGSWSDVHFVRYGFCI